MATRVEGLACGSIIAAVARAWLRSRQGRKTLTRLAIARHPLPRCVKRGRRCGNIGRKSIAMNPEIAAERSYAPDSRYAWWRLAAAVGLSTIGGVGLWSTVIVLPTIETAFGVDRGGASIPYTATMIGFAAGGIMMGRLTD